MIFLSIWQEPVARISTGSQPMRKRDMSRSCTAMSAKMPPPPLTYSKGGGDGSREQSLTMWCSPTSPASMALFTRRKFGSKRRCRAVKSLTPALLQRLMASMVSARSVAMGFSQKMCLPAAAQRLIWSAWKLDGEQIHTASTSGFSMTSTSEPEKFGTLYCLAAASALDTVGFEMITVFTFGQLESASRCTRPMRPAPMTPTFTVFMCMALRTVKAWEATAARATRIN
mmetsp:Transcript_39266/g.122914  ORF Transcript_39266/g.122914 Transcript_39266/m.122914 type:complete len:228 (-) Transcript_39266:77-760(-)